jgi:hypothetical protein
MSGRSFSASLFPSAVKDRAALVGRLGLLLSTVVGLLVLIGSEVRAA